MKPLLDRLASLDSVIASGVATLEQKKHRGDLAALANAAELMLDALEERQRANTIGHTLEHIEANALADALAKQAIFYATAFYQNSEDKELRYKPKKIYIPYKECVVDLLVALKLLGEEIARGCNPKSLATKWRDICEPAISKTIANGNAS